MRAPWDQPLLAREELLMDWTMVDRDVGRFSYVLNVESIRFPNGMHTGD